MLGCNAPVKGKLAKADNLLNQTLAPSQPNQAWVSDITHIPTDEGWLYLAGIKDVYTCESSVTHWGERHDQRLVHGGFDFCSFEGLLNRKDCMGRICNG